MIEFGQPISDMCKQRAYDAAKEMGVQDRFGLVSGMADCLENDKPYEAMEHAQKQVDLTGAYRLIATLIADQAP